MQQWNDLNLALSSSTLQKLQPSVLTNIEFVAIPNPEKLFITMALNFLGATSKNFLIAMVLKDSPQLLKTHMQTLSLRNYMFLWENNFTVSHLQVKIVTKILLTSSKPPPF